jgi:hypothetical protein
MALKQGLNIGHVTPRLSLNLSSLCGAKARPTIKPYDI